MNNKNNLLVKLASRDRISFAFICLSFFIVEKLFAQPSITSINPVSGPAGATVTISGSNFDTSPNNNIVYFGSVRAAVTGGNGNSLTVNVPYGGIHGPVSVTSNNLTAYSKAFFLTTYQGMGAKTMNQAFRNVLTKPVGTYPSCISTGDLDSDGKPDLVVGSVFFNALSIYRNTSTPGSFSFQDVINVPTELDQYGVALGDLDSDGKLDIACSNFNSSSISVLRNTSSVGSISFQPKVDYPVAGAGTSGICIDDLNLDGKPDMVICSRFGNSISIYINNTVPGSSITFAPQIILKSNQPSSVTTGDVDGDGKPELVVTSFVLSWFSVYRNTTTNDTVSFAPEVNIPANTSPLGTCLADIDGDGRLDVSVANFNGNSVTFSRNSSSPGYINFDPRFEYNPGGGTRQVAAGDLDGDGKVDIGLVNQTGNSMSIFQNSSLFDWVVYRDYWRSYAAGSEPTSLVICDIDSDGKSDIVITNSGDNNIMVFKNGGGEAYVQSSGINPVGNITRNVFVVDSSVQPYNGLPFVQRHYDIEPKSNVSSATATISLYFTQQDFDNYNAYTGHGLNLPKNSTDEANKANLIVYQYHGLSATGSPGTYSGNAVQINPDDDKILWIRGAQLWEVTFDVIGFSGFFISSTGNNVLPLKLQSFTAKLSGSTCTLLWSTEDERNVSHFELQRSEDGNDFNKIAYINVTHNNTKSNYDYINTIGSASNYYYRLKIVDQDGTSVYSKVLIIIPHNLNNSFSVYPNPADNYINVRFPITSQSSRLIIMDMTGKLIRIFNIDKNMSAIRVSVKGMKPGSYHLLWKAGQKNISQNLLIK